MPKKFTEEELELLHNTELSANELSKLLSVHAITIFRWRSSLNIEVSRGAKLGKPCLAKVTRFEQTCAREECSNVFETVPSANKKYCSRYCNGKESSFTYNNPAKPGVSRPWRLKEDRPEYIRYQQTVHNLSHKTYLENKDIINPNNYLRGRAGVKGAYQLDHITTIKEGFNRGISPEEMSKVENLRMLPWSENLKRNRNNASH
jgi:hypothetical protein